MIGRIKGILLEKRAPELLVDVQGIGYEIMAPMSTFYVLPETGQTVTLHTHLVVREDSQTLFGFAHENERMLFRSLIKVNGVGAKLALAILSGVSTTDFIHCIEHQDASALVKLPGVGKKTAERLIVEMKDRVKDLAGEQTVASQPGPTLVSGGNTVIEDAMSALVALGYKAPEASRMIRAIDNGQEYSSEELIRQALQAAAAK